MQFTKVSLKALKPSPLLVEPITLGDKIRHRRIREGLTQKQAGECMGVDAYTVLNWEKSNTTPLPKDWPNIASFLDSDDIFPQASTIAEKLRTARLRKGWSRKVAAKELGVDESTLRDWEGNKVILLAKHRRLVADFLGMPFDEMDAVMRAVWNGKHRNK